MNTNRRTPISFLQQIIDVTKYLQENIDSVDPNSVYSDLQLIRNLTDKIEESV